MKYFVGVILLMLSLHATNNCLSCHKGIADIRDRDSGMMKKILKVADHAGYKGNDCIVCHGGNPDSLNKDKAHKGTPVYFKDNKGPKAFYPYPASAWINENTCGICHPKQVSAQWNNLMATEQGKIHGALWGFGAKDGYNHTYTNFGGSSVEPHKRLGTKVYQEYMDALKKQEPQGFFDKQKNFHLHPQLMR